MSEKYSVTNSGIESWHFNNNNNNNNNTNHLHLRDTALIGSARRNSEVNMFPPPLRGGRDFGPTQCEHYPLPADPPYNMKILPPGI